MSTTQKNEDENDRKDEKGENDKNEGRYVIRQKQKRKTIEKRTKKSVIPNLNLA